MANSNVVKCPECGTPHIPKYTNSFKCTKCPYQTRVIQFRSFEELVGIAGHFYTPLQISRLCLETEYIFPVIHDNGDENEFSIKVCCSAHAKMTSPKFSRLCSKVEQASRTNRVFKLPNEIQTVEKFWEYLRDPRTEF